MGGLRAHTQEGAPGCDGILQLQSWFLPFLVFVSHKELVQLLALELELVVVVLLDRLRVRDGIVLGGQELLQRHHARLGLHVAGGLRFPGRASISKEFKNMLQFAPKNSPLMHRRRMAVRAATATPVHATVVVVASAITSVHPVRVVTPEAATPSLVTPAFAAHPLHRRTLAHRRVAAVPRRWPIVTVVLPGSSTERKQTKFTF